MTHLPAKAIILFPESRAFERPGLARALEAIRFRFGEAVPVHAAVGPDRATEARAAGLLPVDPAAALTQDADTWVLAPGFLPIFHGDGGFEKVALPGDAAQRQGKTLFILEPDSFIHPLKIASDGALSAPCMPDYDGHLEKNVFSRLGSRDFRGAAYFFPLNGYYVGHPSAFGPIDEFGFRNAVDLATLAKRDANHIVIAVFGGSTAWSPCCLQHETFSSVIEQRLRTAFAARGDARQISVFNFGVSGHTLLNEMISWMLFCHRLKPEIVIAHDLFNDLANGVQTDPDLLNRFDMTYMSAMEQWGQRLMSAPQVPLTQSPDPKVPLRIASSPQAVARAYLTRKRQFSNLVEQSGATFIWGTQPAWFGKPPSPKEAERFANIRALSPQMDPMYRSLPPLYDMVRDAQQKSSIAHYVDVQAEFGRLSAEDDVFIDHCHVNPRGDALIGDIYARVILDRVLKT